MSIYFIIYYARHKAEVSLFLFTCHEGYTLINSFYEKSILDGGELFSDKSWTLYYTRKGFKGHWEVVRYRNSDKTRGGNYTITQNK